MKHPDEQGYWWFRSSPKGSWRICWFQKLKSHDMVFVHGIGKSIEDFEDPEFQGPIPEPNSPDQAPEG